ncbi:Starch-binding associating with outer membrane [Dyadobacter koreensis]|uniref:Starch-binding associating with outer membrane n=1 Tax=Dyadobacter koreensis TaxID=408657 RepID=A0A1H6RQL8_9BACT|nr:SusD/RagB family nutrient-binding outer membrane lipoprotein [Dyadobacter koreensis]SEI55674.1 Starch-binding associating with outer membrane [Dyadobacter koreensis]
MKKSLIVFLSFLLLTGCVDSLDDYNVDTKKAPTVTAVTLFSNSLKGLIDALVTPNVNNNNYRLYVQQWAETTYLDEQRYNLTARAIPQALWQSLYRDVISDLTEAKKILNANTLLSAESKNNQLAQIEIVEVLAWSVLVNTFGDIPYTQAMDPLNPLPKFDDAKTVYYSLLDRLDAALLLLNTTGTGFGAGDLIYKGDIAKWRKFGNSLKLRLALVIADSDAAKAKTLIAAAAPNVFTANADKAAFPYVATPPNYNPVAQNLNPTYSTRQDYVITSVFIDPMNELNDPRRQQWFTTVGGVYKGGAYGFANTYADFSKVGTKIVDPTLEGIFMDYSEVEFSLAEAIERGLITGDAADHYNKAITASITYWGGSATDAATYIAQPKVAYATATGDYKQKIGFQKWFALYNRGWESWVEWRRLDYPKLLPPTGGSAPAGLQIPVRIIYPIVEQTLNPTNLKTASAAIGGDLASTKLWWDKF